jgi:hypothetical protein
MKAFRILFCLCILAVLVPSAEALTLYGSTSAGGPGELWIIDPTTGAGVQDVGPLNDATNKNYAVTGLAFSPITGVLYGSTGGKTGTLLLTINPATALVTVVGSFNTPSGATMADIAFDQSGNLFGVGSSGGPNLYSINLSNGQATVVGPSGLPAVPGTSGGGLAISPGGIFYGTPTTTQFGTYNPTTGAFTYIATPAQPAGSTASYSALAFSGNTLYGLNLGTPTHLVTITPSGSVTDIGTSVNLIDGVAFQPIIARPALSIKQAGGSVLIDWPASASGFHLQQNPDLGTTNWVANSSSVTSTGGTNEVSISPTNGSMFFRLVSP